MRRRWTVEAKRLDGRNADDRWYPLETKRCWTRRGAERWARFFATCCFTFSGAVYDTRVVRVELHQKLKEKGHVA